AREPGALVPPAAAVDGGHAARGLDDRRERDAQRLARRARLRVDRGGDEAGGEPVAPGPQRLEARIGAERVAELGEGRAVGIAERHARGGPGLVGAARRLERRGAGAVVGARWRLVQAAASAADEEEVELAAPVGVAA